MNSLLQLSAVEMARLVRSREILAVELVEAHLEQIRKFNPALNAFVSLNERAIDLARDADRAIASGRPAGPLHGVPVSIKSSVEVAGLKCETGTRLREGYVGHVDAPLVARLKNAGAIVMGSTNVPEFLMAWETDNALYGRTNSAWDLERTPGGSSGGEAAAISAGLSAGGIGSDGGGSIRVPAHFSGICGLKPTPGRIPGTGHFPACVGPFSLLGVVGPMARTIADVRALFEVIAGPDNGDPMSAPVPLRSWNDKDLRRVRVGYFEMHQSTPVTAETRNAVRLAADALRQDGFEVVPFVPDGLVEARRLWWTLFGRGVCFVLKPLFAGREHDMHEMLQEFFQYVAAEPPLTTEILMTTLFDRDVLRARFLDQMRDVPVFICPVSSTPAFRHRERKLHVDDGIVDYLQSFSYTQWFNLIGNPGAVVPAVRSREGLPIGVQIVGRPYEEELVLAIAERIEKSLGGWQEPPLTRSSV